MREEFTCQPELKDGGIARVCERDPVGSIPAIEASLQTAWFPSRDAAERIHCLDLSYKPTLQTPNFRMFWRGNVY